MVTTLTQTFPHLKWDITRYHEAARLGVLGDRQLELLDGDIIVVPPLDPFHELNCDRASIANSAQKLNG